MTCLQREPVYAGYEPYNKRRVRREIYLSYMNSLSTPIKWKISNPAPLFVKKTILQDVFCNDLREASAIDYSKPILDWLRDSKKEALEKWEEIVSGKLQPKQKALVASKTKPNLPRFKAFQMHKTRFCDLNFRLGAGYLYCHQVRFSHYLCLMVYRQKLLVISYSSLQS